MPAPDSIRHLVATDRQIDALVYQLYGLTDVVEVGVRRAVPLKFPEMGIH